jgi:tetratricopeptide (TPR) repeat protein
MAPSDDMPDGPSPAPLEQSVVLRPRGAGEPADDVGKSARIGRFVVLRRLGDGAMGVVYSAFDAELDRKVAIKVLRRRLHGDSHGPIRLLREAKSLAQLSHPNVVAIYEVGRFNDHVFIAMEFVDGQTARAWLQAAPRSWREVLGVYLQAGRGLAAAHRAGLVHRDFKPDNVLVGADGRVRVVDFGLARAKGGPDLAADAADAAVPRVSGSFDVALTAAGTLVGTPAYMPLEQLDGEADARSDQFSFCVALYEALYSVRPFRGENLLELRQSLADGAPQAPPRDLAVPPRIHRLLVRGLATDRDRRHATMDDLLAALAEALERPRKLWLALAAATALLALALALVAVLALRGAAGPQCTGAPARLAGVWDAPRRAALERAILDSGLSYAPDTAARSAAALDAYTAAWVAMHVDACEAHQRGEQSAELLDRRMACLDDRRTEVRELVDVLSAGGDPAVERAAQAVSALSPLARCADAAALLAQEAPEDPEAARAVRDRLARANAQEAAGLYTEGLAVLDAVDVDAQALGVPRLRAEALARRARLLERLGQYDAAESTYFAALAAAEAARDDTLRARVVAALVHIVGGRLRRFDEALHLAGQARAVLDRVGGEPQIALDLGINAGNLHYLRGALPDAHASLQQALALGEQHFGADDARLVPALVALGNVLLAQGQPDAALAHLRRGLALWEALLGPDHPRLVAPLLSVVAAASESDATLPLAETSARRAVAIAERALGPDHLDTLSALRSLGQTLGLAGQYAAAEPFLRRTLAGHEQRLGPHHIDVVGDLQDLAVAVGEQGRVAEAEQLAERAYAAWQVEKDRSPAAEYLAELLAQLGGDALAAGRQGDAVRLLAAAVALHREVLAADRPERAGPLQRLADLHLEAGRPADAAPLLREALGPGDVVPAATRAALEFRLARALWATGARDEARRLAESALDRQAHAADVDPDERTRVERWLAAHPHRPR